jgi:hypothetical protein
VSASGDLPEPFSEPLVRVGIVRGDVAGDPGVDRAHGGFGTARTNDERRRSDLTVLFEATIERDRIELGSVLGEDAVEPLRVRS